MNKAKQRMPAIFVGHGSPLNALEDNQYTQDLCALGRRLPAPRAILSISAHWLTRQVTVTHMSRPRTIHDFYGFPAPLFAVQYPAPGSPALAEEIHGLLQGYQVVLDDTEWGLDHGSWAVLKYLFPLADVPVVQLGIPVRENFAFHLQLGRQLSVLREQGVLIVGSGNIVHNLEQIRWETDARPFSWAIEFDELIKDALLHRDFNFLLTAPDLGILGKLSVPTVEHYLPLLYVAGASRAEDQLDFVHEGLQNGSMAMRTLIFEERFS